MEVVIVGIVGVLRMFSDLEFVQYINAVYTDTLAMGKAPDGIRAITADEVLDNIRKLKQGSAIDEEIHRREAAEGMLNLQNSTQKREYLAK